MSLSVDIQKDFGDFRLDVSFETGEGITGLLGASGSGKSLTLRCIAGIEKPDKGKIILNGVTLFDSSRKINLPPQKRRVGYLFQNYALFPNMTVEQNIMCGLCREKDRAYKKEKTGELMKKMMLTGLEKHKPHQLSGGQQQRTALARILVNQPEILLLDEPFSALDSFLKIQLQPELKRLLKEYNKDAILVTHDRNEAYRLCNELLLMGKGSIHRSGEVKELFRSPGTRQAARITGCKNIADAEKISDYEVYVPQWHISLKCAEKVEDNLCAVGIRAHYLNAGTPHNKYRVRLVETVEEPFEWIYKFRFEEAEPQSSPVWWRVTKEKKMSGFPEELGVSPQNIMLLYR